MTDIEELAKPVLDADATRDFLQSRVGKLLMERIEEDIANAEADFRKADPTDTKKIMEIQNRLLRAESITQWLGEIIVAGDNALQQAKDLSE